MYWNIFGSWVWRVAKYIACCFQQRLSTKMYSKLNTVIWKRHIDIARSPNMSFEQLKDYKKHRCFNRRFNWKQMWGMLYTNDDLRCCCCCYICANLQNTTYGRAVVGDFFLCFCPKWALYVTLYYCHRKFEESPSIISIAFLL